MDVRTGGIDRPAFSHGACLCIGMCADMCTGMRVETPAFSRVVCMCIDMCADVRVDSMRPCQHSAALHGGGNGHTLHDRAIDAPCSGHYVMLPTYVDGTLDGLYGDGA